MPILVPTSGTVIASTWGKSVADALNLPREINYTQLTTNKTITSTTEASADAVIQAPAITFDGATAVLIEFFAPAVVPASVAGAMIMSWLYQDGVSIGRMATVATPAAGQMIAPMYAMRRLTPSAGSHSYTWGATNASGAGSIFGGAGGLGQYVPAYLRISRAAAGVGA